MSGIFRRISARNRSKLAVASATVLALVLRAAAARGDLGLDEAWSLRLVSKIAGLGEVFWGISHDNNHFLNSAWLFVMEPDRSPWVYRLPAVVLGALTVPAVARWLGRENPAAGVIGAVLAAVALPLVDFGSEARGYAGLALATVLALDASGRATDAALAPAPDWPRLRRASWQLGWAVGFGALSHLAMATTVAVVGLTTLARIASTKRQLGPTLVFTTRIFLPSAFLVLPAALAVLAGLVNRGHFTIGDVDPFSIGKLAQGLGEMLVLTSGLSDACPPWAGLAIALLMLAVAARFRLVSRPLLLLATVALVVLPGAMAAARLPNVAYARYFSVCGIALLALQAGMLGHLWQRGATERRRVTAVVLALAAGSLTLDGLLLRDGRGGFGETLALMQAEGNAFYTTSHPAMAVMLLESAASTSGRPPARLAGDDICRERPDWYIAVGRYDPRPEATVMIGPAACPVSYHARAPFLASPLSGTQWTLYRRN